LQHRGQESAGIAVSDGAAVRIHRGMGLVAQVFSPATIQDMGPGSILALGHTRYSTTGSSRAENAHPLPFHHPQLGPGAIAHNGNLLNAEALRRQLEEEGAVFDTSLDTEVMARLIEHTHGKTWEEVIRRTFARVVGAYSCGIITPTQLIALRDPYGFRPLCLGYIPLPGQPAHVIASRNVRARHRPRHFRARGAAGRDGGDGRARSPQRELPDVKQARDVRLRVHLLRAA